MPWCWAPFRPHECGGRSFGLFSFRMHVNKLDYPQYPMFCVAAQHHTTMVIQGQLGKSSTIFFSTCFTCSIDFFFRSSWSVQETFSGVNTEMPTHRSPQQLYHMYTYTDITTPTRTDHKPQITHTSRQKPHKQIDT